ncbi:MAG: hypothetical protein LUB59_04385 [Candidatus Gastranaerophilales bacterium]|nr:hypothetical protein [Candidatus Gastranaerophilales bacterium]
MKKAVIYSTNKIDDCIIDESYNDFETLFQYVNEHQEVKRVYLHEEDFEHIRALLFARPDVEIVILAPTEIRKIIKVKEPLS